MFCVFFWIILIGFQLLVVMKEIVLILVIIVCVMGSVINCVRKIEWLWWKKLWVLVWVLMNCVRFGMLMVIVDQKFILVMNSMISEVCFLVWKVQMFSFLVWVMLFRVKYIQVEIVMMVGVVSEVSCLIDLMFSMVLVICMVVKSVYYRNQLEKFRKYLLILFSVNVFRQVWMLNYIVVMILCEIVGRCVLQRLKGVCRQIVKDSLCLVLMLVVSSISVLMVRFVSRIVRVIVFRLNLFWMLVVFSEQVVMMIVMLIQIQVQFSMLMGCWLVWVGRMFFLIRVVWLCLVVSLFCVSDMVLFFVSWFYVVVVWLFFC